MAPLPRRPRSVDTFALPAGISDAKEEGKSAEAAIALAELEE